MIIMIIIIIIILIIYLAYFPNKYYQMRFTLDEDRERNVFKKLITITTEQFSNDYRR